MSKEKPSVPVKPKRSEVVDGYTIKYYAGGKTRWSKGKLKDGQPYKRSQR